MRNIFSKTPFYILTIFMSIIFYISVNNLKVSIDEIYDKQMQNIEIVMENMFLKLIENDCAKKITAQANTFSCSVNKTVAKMKYILQWTSPYNKPFLFMGKGQQGFIERNCSYNNCFVTNNRTYLEDYTHFNVIAFNGPEVLRMDKSDLPSRRSLQQKYVFGSMESSDSYPACSNKYDNFFNWTWTYKLEPYSKWGYIIVRYSDYNIIGPNNIMHWIKISEMHPVSDELKEKLQIKETAAAWFVSNCKSRSGRENFVTKLQKELKIYNLSVDVYGRCGPFKCSRVVADECDNFIDNYYFYLAFENSFAEDYVTEKLLRALKHNAVPIVFGGANYTRFMPDGIYLNARQLGAKKLAKKMNELITNRDQYAEYFRWKNHYSYHATTDSPESDGYCRFCATLNDEELMTKFSVVKDFQRWWDPPGRC